MDEMVNDVVEEVSPVDEGTGEGLSDAEFDAMWDDDDDSYEMFAEEATEDTADQPTQEPDKAEETEPTETKQSEPDADQYLELKHFDEVKKVTKDEAKVLAQKGMDYDRIRGRLSEAEEANKKLAKYEAFLKEIQGDFPSIDDLMNDTRARVKADKDGISYEDALKQVQNANQQKEQKPQVDEATIIQNIRKASFTEFAKEHPDIKPADIPQEVWQDLEKTNNLSASYAKYEAKQLQNEIAVLKKNAENKSRTVGSMKSSGTNRNVEKSEFDRVFDEDDW